MSINIEKIKEVLIKNNITLYDGLTDEEFEKILDKVALEMGYDGTSKDSKELHYDTRFAVREDTKTIHGGDYYISYFYDENGNPCLPELAKRVNTVEYTKSGKRINETYGLLG